MALTEPHVLIAWPLFINLHFPLSLGKANGVFVRIFCSVEVELLPRGRDVLMVSKGSREYGWPMVVGTKLAQSSPIGDIQETVSSFSLQASGSHTGSLCSISGLWHFLQVAGSIIRAFHNRAQLNSVLLSC